MSFLDIKELCAGYPQGFKLKSIDLSVKRSSFLGIIGPNGSGKSTLLKTIAGIITPFSGSIFIENEKMSKLKRKDISKKIGYVSQFVENDEIKVIDYVLLGRLPHFKKFQFFESKEDIAVAKEYINLLNLSGYEEKYLYELSGGERQMVSICSALVQEPEILLLDEPTAHLDLKHQIEILNFLQELNETKNITIITVLHDLNLASEYCNFLLLLKDGSIFAKGGVFDVLRYDILEEVYETVVVVEKNPISNKPIVLPASRNTLKFAIARGKKGE